MFSFEHFPVIFLGTGHIVTMQLIREPSSPYLHTYFQKSSFNFCRGLLVWFSSDSPSSTTRPVRKWNRLSNAFNFHYSARLWSLSIIGALTVRWINWCIWQGQLLLYVVLTAGFDIEDLSASPSRGQWERWLSESGEDISEFSPHSQQLQIIFLLNRITDILNLNILTHVRLSQNNNLHGTGLTKWEKGPEKLIKLVALNWETFSNDFKCPLESSYTHCAPLSWVPSSDGVEFSSWPVDLVASAAEHTWGSF